MADADVVSCCLHAFVLSICCRSSCGDGGIRIALQTQRQIQFPKIKIATISVRMVKQYLSKVLVTSGLVGLPLSAVLRVFRQGSLLQIPSWIGDGRFQAEDTIGDKDYLPHFYSERIILGNCVCLCFQNGNSRGTLIELPDRKYLT